MSELARQMPYTIAFPQALGTGLIIHTNHPVEEDERRTIGHLIENYERTLSRFREDSLVTAIGRAQHGGTFDLPDWTIPFLDLYDALHNATDGAIDPCVGEDLIRLGYDARYTFRMSADAHGRLGAIHGRAVWHNDIERHGSTLTTRRPIRLDFGACGKGYLVDLIADRIANRDERTGQDSGMQSTPAPRPDCRGAVSTQSHDPQPDTRSNGAQPQPARSGEAFITSHRPHPKTRSNGTRADMPPSTRMVIDAGGDLYVRSDEPITIAMEDPHDDTRAIGTITLRHGSCCASAPSRRHWRLTAQREAHHLINAVDGLPVDEVAATWVTVGARLEAEASSAETHPTPTKDRTRMPSAQRSNPQNEPEYADGRTETIPTICATHATESPQHHGSPQPPTSEQSPTPVRPPEFTRPTHAPTALADGLATALFVTEPERLARYFRFECAVLRADRTVLVSRGFPGEVFTK